MHFIDTPGTMTSLPRAAPFTAASAAFSADIPREENRTRAVSEKSVLTGPGQSTLTETRLLFRLSSPEMPSLKRRIYAFVA